MTNTVIALIGVAIFCAGIAVGYAIAVNRAWRRGL